MIKLLLKETDYGNITNLLLLILRLIFATLMLTHGIPKLGKIIAGDFNFPNPVGLGSAGSLILTTFAEFICSLFIAAGLGTKLAAIPLIITMGVILFIVHVDEPLMRHYNVLIYFIGYIILLIAGGGKYSFGYYFQQRNRR